MLLNYGYHLANNQKPNNNKNRHLIAIQILSENARVISLLMEFVIFYNTDEGKHLTTHSTHFYYPLDRCQKTMSDKTRKPQVDKQRLSARDWL